MVVALWKLFIFEKVIWPHNSIFLKTRTCSFIPTPLLTTQSDSRQKTKKNNDWLFINIHSASTAKWGCITTMFLKYMSQWEIKALYRPAYFLANSHILSHVYGSIYNEERNAWNSASKPICCIFAVTQLSIWSRIWTQAQIWKKYWRSMVFWSQVHRLKRCRDEMFIIQKLKLNMTFPLHYELCFWFQWHLLYTYWFIFTHNYN